MATTTAAPNGPHYPSHFDLYRKCPRRYWLKVIERRRVDEPFSAPLEKGRVAHAVLKTCANHQMKLPPSCPANLHALVEALLPREPYASDAAWRVDVEEIVGWVKYALEYIGSPAKILGAELFRIRKYRGDEECAPFTAGALLDLILLRRDANDNLYAELVDYKTGKSGWENPLAPVISRFVAKPLLDPHLPGGPSARVVWTELFVAERVAQHTELDLQLCAEGWEQLKRLVVEIGAEEVFPPSPSPQNCRFCPYSGNGCDAAMPEDDDGELW
jgi:PD-(D/E)XK nuclease superfamily